MSYDYRVAVGQELTGLGGKEVVRHIREGFLREVTTEPSAISLEGGF